jgi:elongation factor G
VLISSDKVVYGDIPNDMIDLVKKKRSELIATLADYDEEIADLFLEEVDPSHEQLKVFFNS